MEREPETRRPWPLGSVVRYLGATTRRVVIGYREAELPQRAPFARRGAPCPPTPLCVTIPEAPLASRSTLVCVDELSELEACDPC